MYFCFMVKKRRKRYSKDYEEYLVEDSGSHNIATQTIFKNVQKVSKQAYFKGKIRLKSDFTSKSKTFFELLYYDFHCPLLSYMFNVLEGSGNVFSKYSPPSYLQVSWIFNPIHVLVLVCVLWTS